MIKIKLLIFFLFLFLLFSCTSIQETKNHDYLDDNYSDRWDLAIKLLGKYTNYIDTTNYGKMALVETSTVNEIEGLKFNKTTESSLLKTLKKIDEDGKKIAISGLYSKNTYNIINDAFKQFDRQLNHKTTILYIGDEKFKYHIEKIIIAHGAKFLYAALPKTSL